MSTRQCQHMKYSNVFNVQCDVYVWVWYMYIPSTPTSLWDEDGQVYKDTPNVSQGMVTYRGNGVHLHSLYHKALPLYIVF